MSAILGLLLAMTAGSLEEWDAAGEVPIQKTARVATESVPGFVWVDAEDLADYGGWKADTQFVHLMGSAYLIAAGVGEPVADATGVVQIGMGGTFRVWARTRDWLPEHHPGRFQVVVNGRALDKVLGESARDDWAWVHVGDARLEAGGNTLALHDLTGYFARCDALLLAKDADYVPPADVEGIEKERARLTGLSLDSQHRGDFDVVVVGGGPAGCPAAIAAARLGARTALIQDRPVLGGNASLELNLGMQGASISLRNARETGIVEEASRMREHEGFRSVSVPFHQLAEAEVNLTLFLNTRAVGVTMASRDRIGVVKGVDTLTGEYSTYGAKLVVDCTGDGWVGYYAGAEYRFGRESRSEFDEPDAPETADSITMSGCVMGRHGIGFKAAETSAPVAYDAPAWAAEFPDLVTHGRRPRNITTGEWWLEHPGTFDDLYNPEQARDELIRISFGYWNYLKNAWPERDTLRSHAITFVPWIVARRETRRLVGDHILNAHEVLAGTLFADRVSYGGWPVDIHNPRGVYQGNTPYHTNYHIERVYTIPFRCLYSKNVENLLFAGRCASFSHFGLGTARVERTLATLGQAAGTAAALCAAKDITPRDVYEYHMDALQQTLLKYDQYIPEVRNEDPDDLARTATVTASGTAVGAEFRRDDVRLDPLYHHLDHRRAFMMPVAHGKVVRAGLYMKSDLDDDVTLELHLREARGSEDFSAAADVATASTVLPGKGEQWLVFEFDRAISTPYAWVYLEPQKGVHWRLMTTALPEMCRAYASKGPETEVTWHRPNGYYACYLEPPAMTFADYGPGNVVSGVARVTADATHMWCPEPAAELPQWIELAFPKPTTFNTVHVTFVTGLDRRRFSSPEDITGVTDYALAVPDGAQWRTLVRETGNIQRWRRHTFDSVTASKLRVQIDGVSGSQSAGVYEVRVYDEPR